MNIQKSGAKVQKKTEPAKESFFYLRFRTLIRTFEQVLSYSRSENCKFICVFAHLFVPLQPNLQNDYGFLYG
jgi:hypothetical protein